jgi:glycerophosphoryl diester phosphodiesterase
MFSWLAPKRKPVLVAHRGSSATAPENTLAAFRSAIDDGADAIELDVHLTKDNQVIVIHDATLSRTTDGRGNIGDLTFRELRRFSAGSWFHKRFSAETIPSLEEVFKIVPATAGINIELKFGIRTKRTETLTERCVQIVQQAKRGESIFISSFHHASIKKVKQIDSSLLTGCLYHSVSGKSRLPVSAAVQSKSDLLILNRRYCTRMLVQKAHENGLSVGEYVIDTKRQLQRALRNGTDIIFTNDPAIIVKALLPANLAKVS